MPKVIEVIYEDGVFKPLKKINIKDKSRGKVVLSKVSDESFGAIKASKKELEKALEELDEEWGFC